MPDGEIVAIPSTLEGRWKKENDAKGGYYFTGLFTFKRVLDSPACLLPIWPDLVAQKTSFKTSSPITDLLKNL